MVKERFNLLWRPAGLAFSAGKPQNFNCPGKADSSGVGGARSFLPRLRKISFKVGPGLNNSALGRPIFFCGDSWGKFMYPPFAIRRSGFFFLPGVVGEPESAPNQVRESSSAKSHSTHLF